MIAAKNRKPWRWTRYRAAIRSIVRRDGIGATRRWMRENREKAACEEGWRGSELAMTIAHDEREIENVAERMRRAGETVAS